MREKGSVQRLQDCPPILKATQNAKDGNFSIHFGVNDKMAAVRTDSHRRNEFETFAKYPRRLGDAIKCVSQFIQVTVGLVDRPHLDTIGPYVFEITEGLGDDRISRFSGCHGCRAFAA